MSTGPISVVGKIRSAANLRGFVGCRSEMLALAESIEDGTLRQDVFERLIESESPHAERAARKIVDWMMEASGEPA